MANVLTFSRTTGSSERPAMNHTLASSKFTANQTINVTGNITSIVYKFIFKYTGSSNPSWTGYASIVASDGTTYKGTSLTKTIKHDTNVSMSLTIPEANCPPPSVINSNNFKVKLTTTNCSKDPYVPASSKMSIVITYEDKKTQAYVWTTGGWTEATPYIWKTTPSTIELPKQAMTSNESQGCIASSSSIYDSNQQAFRAFNKSISSSDYCWASANSDTSPWIQITLPQKLYNIELEIHNRHDYNNATGITNAIIYGSNDGGLTLTQIGTISGRSAAFKAMSVETCNNTDVGYSTIKLDITGHGGTDVTVGEIYIRGTDVLEGGGWVPVSPYLYNGEWV